MDSSDCQEYGIIFLIPQDVVMEAKRLNQIVAHNLPELTNKENNYHISLFHGRFTKDGIHKIYEKLNAMKIKPIEMTFSQPIFNQNNQYPIWRIEKNLSLTNLHETVIKIALPYKHGALQRCLEDYNSLNINSKNQVNKYGTSGVLEDYNPHVTLFYGEKPNDKMPTIVKQLIPDVQFKNFLANSIAIGELGYFGNLTRILYVVNLKKFVSA